MRELLNGLFLDQNSGIMASTAAIAFGASILGLVKKALKLAVSCAIIAAVLLVAWLTYPYWGPAVASLLGGVSK